MTALTIAPNKFFEFAKDGVCEVSTLYTSSAVSANNLLVAAVTGKKVKVVSLTAQTDNAARGVLKFLSASGGTLLWGGFMPTNAQDPYKLDPNILGWFETKTGEGLYSTIELQPVFYSIQYIVYTP